MGMEKEWKGVPEEERRNECWACYTGHIVGHINLGQQASNLGQIMERFSHFFDRQGMEMLSLQMKDLSRQSQGLIDLLMDKVRPGWREELKAELEKAKNETED